MTNEFDLAIVGNGIIGCLAAIRLSSPPYNRKVVLIGPKNRSGSASVAAGAMLNVFGEIDYVDAQQAYVRRKLAIGEKSIAKWCQFLEHHRITDDILVADKTIVYLKPDATELETGCFEAIKLASMEAGTFKEQTSAIKHLRRSMKIGESCQFLQLEKEMALSTPMLFDWFDQEFRRSENITVLDAKANSLEPRKSSFVISTELNQVKADKVICAAGSFTKDILGDLGNSMMPLLFGVGTAMQVTSENHLIADLLPDRSVVRTPNRGSTCGIHLVPRSENSFYLGAGSYLSRVPYEGHRMATVKYLIDCLEEDFSGEFEKSLVSPQQGYRPIALDGKPMLGPLSENPGIYVATGTKRDGLTYAPLIVDDMELWLSGQALLDDFIGWEPDRKPISYGTREFATQAYVDNKLAGLLEHNTISPTDANRVEEELRLESNKFHNKISSMFGLEADFGVHPEVLNIF